MHKIEHKYQSLIRNNYLDNTHGIRVYDLKLKLKREHLLSNDNVNKIIEHIINNNRFIEVDDKGQTNTLLFELFKHPRRKPIEHPHSIYLPQKR